MAQITITIDKELLDQLLYGFLVTVILAGLVYWGLKRFQDYTIHQYLKQHPPQVGHLLPQSTTRFMFICFSVTCMYKLIFVSPMIMVVLCHQWQVALVVLCFDCGSVGRLYLSFHSHWPSLASHYICAFLKRTESHPPASVCHSYMCTCN